MTSIVASDDGLHPLTADEEAIRVTQGRPDVVCQAHLAASGYAPTRHARPDGRER